MVPGRGAVVATIGKTIFVCVFIGRIIKNVLKNHCIRKVQICIVPVEMQN
jgi:hypothetical protein